MTLYSRSVAPSWTAINVLLSISTCLAAFCPSVIRDHSRLKSSDSVSVAFFTSQTSRHYVPPTISRQTPFAIYFNEEDTRRSGSIKSAVSDDDKYDISDGNDSDDDTKRGMRARVRQRVTKASKKVQQLVSGGGSGYAGLNDVREVVSMGVSGSPIAGVLTDAALNAAELAAEEVRTAALDVLQRKNKQQKYSSSSSKSRSSQLEAQARIEADAQIAISAISLAKTSVADAFHSAEVALTAAEGEIAKARSELENAKRDATLGLAVAEKAAAEAAARAERASESVLREMAVAEGGEKMLMEQDQDIERNIGNDGGAIRTRGDEIEVKPFYADQDEPSIGGMPSKQQESSDEVMNDDGQLEPSVMAEADESEEEEEYNTNGDEFDVSDLSYEDVDYTLTDMAPPFINEDECLVPGEPVVRVEKAPQNSRRIFAGIDIPVSVDDVWALLTDYPNLQKVVPNLVVNEVLQLYPGIAELATVVHDPATSAADQCQTLADNMKGAVLKQVGGAKVVGINFSARTELEVREWPLGMPDFAHYEDEVFEGKSRAARVKESRGRELTRYVFPRPFALSSLPHKDISMQSVEGDDGEFRMYQGVWRMQPLPGCSPAGGSAMRLTYAVEVSPRPYLPVALVEGRIAQDLCSNLKAIRDIFAARQI